jgi:pyruvate dehydrogenase E2 component (dihydrolipoamide acetyltransferase)
LTRADGLEALEAALSALFAPGAGPPEGFAKAVHRRRADPALREGQAGLAAALFPGGRQSYDGRMALAAYTGPVRVIWGLADGVIPPSHADGLPPAAALHRLPGVGHMPHVEAPGLVARLVSQTVRSAR